MARKHASAKVTDKKLREAIEEFEALCEVRGELAQAAYDAQDGETRQVLERIRDRLRLASTGYAFIQVDPPHKGVVSVKIDQRYLDFNLMFVATEILKDLGLFGIRVASFDFPPMLCTNCGGEIAMTKRPKRKRKVRTT
jgi:hypothetical protein